MKHTIKFIYVCILICFLPAYTQLPDTTKSMTPVIDSSKDVMLEKIKRRVIIDVGLFRIRVRRKVKEDSLNHVKIIKDTL